MGGCFEQFVASVYSALTNLSFTDSTKKRGNKRDALNEDEKKRLSMMAEEDEEDEGITIKVTKS